MATRIRDEWKRVAHGTTLILIDPLHLEKNRDTYVIVVNPLVAPETVSATVPVAIFVKAGDDFEFTLLRQPGTDYVPEIAAAIRDAELQCDCQFRELNIGSDSVIAHQLACGDPIRSLRSQISVSA